MPSPGSGGRVGDGRGRVGSPPLELELAELELEALELDEEAAVVLEVDDELVVRGGNGRSSGFVEDWLAVLPLCAEAEDVGPEDDDADPGALDAEADGPGTRSVASSTMPSASPSGPSPPRPSTAEPSGPSASRAVPGASEVPRSMKAAATPRMAATPAAAIAPAGGIRVRVAPAVAPACLPDP
jgi:hypothetical protein